MMKAWVLDRPRLPTQAALGSCVGILVYLFFPLVDKLPEPLAWHHPSLPLDIFVPYFQSYNLIRIALGYLSVMGLGYFVLPTSMKEKSPSLLFSAMAGMTLGFPVVAATLRLISFFVPLSILHPVALSLYAGTCVALSFRRPPQGGSLRSEFVSAGVLLFWVLLSLVITFHPGGHTFTGHGEGYYAWILKPLAEGEISSHFPIVASHYDELIFNFFLYAGQKAPSQPVVIYWITNALLKVSAGCFFLLLFRLCQLTLFHSVVGAIFLCFAPYSMSPWLYRPLFDSLNPISLSLHPARHVWGALFVGATVLAFRTREKLSAGIVFLLLLALSETALHVYLLSPFLFFLLPAVRGKSPRLSGRWMYGLASGVFLIGILSFQFKSFAGIFLTLYAGLYVALILFRVRSMLVSRYSLLFLTVGIFCLLAGNLPAHHPSVQRLLYRIGIANEKRLPVIDAFHAGTLEPPRSIPRFGYVDAIHGLEGPHLGAWEYLSFYGLLFLFVLALLRFLPAKEEGALAWKEFALWSWAFLPLVFLYVYFVNDMEEAWIKSRFAEMTIYFLVFSGLMALLRKSVPLRAFLAALLLFHTSGPFLKGRLGFYYVNLKYVWALVSHRGEAHTYVSVDPKFRVSFQRLPGN